MADVIRPVPDALTAPFWRGASEGRLCLQRCGACGHINHPPQPLCGWCSSTRLGFEDVAADGRIASYTSSLRRRDTTAPPFTLIVVELDAQAGVLLVGRVEGPRPPWVAIGAAVRGHHEPLPGTDVALLQFTPAAEDA